MGSLSSYFLLTFILFFTCDLSLVTCHFFLISSLSFMISEPSYYFLKSFIPRRIQIAIRRQIIKRQRAQYRDIWPIDKNAAKPPQNWQGWPDGKKFALVLTHDVESKKGVGNCSALLDLDEQMGFKAAFNFVCKDYPIPMDLISRIKDRGFEVGVHGLKHTGNIYRSKETFSKQAVQINQCLKEWDAVGFRSPSMFHNLAYNHDLNIEYDASTFDTDPFEPQPDGVGTIFPFFVPGVTDQKGYVELPYTLPQDFLLFVLMQEDSIDIWKAKLDWIARNGGMALVITHPDYIDFSGNELNHEKYPVHLYEQFLNLIKTKYEGQYWNALPKEMSHFWVEQDRGKAMKSGHSLAEKKKKIWIDLDNSPHVPFFKPILEDLHKRGYEDLLTARDCFQVCGLADLMQLKYKKIGRHYGKNKIMKVAGLLIRSMQLMSTVLKEKPDLAVSHGSRSQVLIASLLNIPTIVIADYEYTQTVARPTYVIVPDMIDDGSVKGYSKAFFKYPGIKEDVYVPGFHPDPSILAALGIMDGELIVTIRPPATEAHYHNPESELLFEATINFLGKDKNTRMVILPRNEKKQTAWVQNNWSEWCKSKKIIFPEHVVDGLNLIWYSDLVISGGGTMNREAAALDVPVYSIFRGKIGAVDRYLSENGRLTLLTSVEDVQTKIRLIKRQHSDNFESSNRKALGKIVDHIERILKEPA